jgi:hypothetical protein
MSPHTPTSYDVNLCHRHVKEFIFIIWILHLLFDNFHYSLSNVWRAFESHWESRVLVFTKWCDDGMGVLTFVVKLKCIVLPTNVKFSEKLVPRGFVQNVHDYWQWILLLSFDFVQLMWVADPVYSVVLLRDGEWAPFALLLSSSFTLLLCC